MSDLISRSADDTFCKSQLITCNRVKECNGVCPFEDALKHADQMQTMNEQHTVDHDRDWIIGCIEHDGFIHTHRFDKANQIIYDALSAEATKKKAELKDNGDWDCPDVDCDECDHHRSVEWCSLAIPNHEEIDDTYKMVNEAFFEGFDMAEKRYRLLIETIEELDKESADAVQVVRCKDCRHSRVYQTDSKGTMQTDCVAFVMPRTVNDDDFCSWGERRKP